jgi:hypothetical protein
MSNGQIARQLVQNGRREDVSNVTHAADMMNLTTVARGDTRALLPAMLQRMQSQVGQVCRLGMPEDGKDAALLVQLIERVFVNALTRTSLAQSSQ